MHWNILSKMRYTTCIVCFLCLRFQQKNYVRRSCNYDRLILSWLTYYFQSSLLSLLSMVNIQYPSRQNVDVFWDFEFSWRLLCLCHHHHHHHHHHHAELARAFMTLSRHPSRSCNKAGRSSERHPVSLQGWSMLVIAGWLSVYWQKMDHNMMSKKKLDNRVFTIFHDFDYC